MFMMLSIRVRRPLLALVALACALPLPLTAQTQGVIAAAPAQPGAALDQPARLVVEQLLLEQALTLLYEESGVPVSFSPSLLPRRVVNCECKELTVSQALRLMLGDSGLLYREIDGHVLVYRPQPRFEPGQRMWVPAPRYAGPVMPAMNGDPRAAAPVVAVRLPAVGVVTGTVREVGTGRPLASAQVVVVGTDRGTLSDQQGNFLILNVPAGPQQVQVTHVGYRTTTQDIVVGAGETVRVAFDVTVSAVELDQIVVTGTPGGSQRRAIGNVVTRVQAADAVQLARVPDMQSLLNARAPGVVITPGTGMVGSGSQVRIRGSSSFSLTNQPLLYVDGVRADNAQGTGPIVQSFSGRVISRLNDFSPDDIESIEIIKGPAAATLYGTEASNGVIHIITKRGREGRAAWNITMRQGANWFQNGLERTPTNWWRNPTTGQLESINLAQTEKARGTPLWRVGNVQSYALNVSGGTSDMRYYLGGDWDYQEGAEVDNSRRRASIRANMNINPGPTLEIASSVGYTTGRTYLSCEAGCGGATWGAYYASPAHNQGNLDPDPRGARSYPAEYYRDADRFQDLDRFTGSLQLNHHPTSWLHQRLTLGMDNVNEDNQGVFERTPLRLMWNPTYRGSKSVTRRDVLNQTVDYANTVRFMVRPDVSAATSTGFQYSRRGLRTVSASGDDFALPGLRVINAAAETSSGETYTANVTVGIYLQQQLGLNDRLFLTGALRADDNSAFGEQFEVVLYPKASATWVVSEEPFWDVPVLNTLRIRSAYGHAGQQPGAFDALRTWSSIPGSNDVGTVTPRTVGNPNLGPERSSEIEAGFDAGMLDDRLGLELTFYRKTTRDAILSRAMEPSTGFPGTRFINIGETMNRGYELLLRGTPVARPRFHWEATFSLAHNDNRIVRLTEDEDAIVVSADFGIEHRVGHPMGAWFHRRVVSAEFDQNNMRILSSMICDDGQGGTTPCYSGTTPVAPYVFVGRADPKHEGAVSSTFTLGERVRVNGLFDFKTGFHKYDQMNQIRCVSQNVCRELLEPSELLETNPIRLAVYQSGNAMGAEYIRDSSFLRFREFSVSYIVPAPLARRIGAGRANVNVAARNLQFWSPWTGLDPEARYITGTRGGFAGIDQNMLPQLTSVVTTINLQF
jgi:TonB-linked SusC/RagA family outer membrane protein